MLKCTVVILFSILVALSTVVSKAQVLDFRDDFDGSQIDSRWTATSLNAASSIYLNGAGGLVLFASPLNGGSDYWSGTNYRAPRIVTPSESDWTIETAFDFAPSHNYQGAGILLIPVNDPASTSGIRIAERAYYPNGGGQVIRSVGAYVGYSGTRQYMRVEKRGSTYTGSWSTDGISWVAGGEATYIDQMYYVGVFCIRQPWDGNLSVASNAVFDYFSYTSAYPPCDAIGFFNAKCNNTGAAQAMVRLLNSTQHAGKTVEFLLDSLVYPVELITNGTHTIGRLQVPHVGSGQHTISLISPAGCFDPVMFTCEVDNGEGTAWFDDPWNEKEEVQVKIVEEPMLGNYPNPFNPVTTIRYDIPFATNATLTIHNVLGQEVARLADGPHEPGRHEVSFDASSVASGIYFYRLTSQEFVEVRRMVVLK